jgi:DNA-binding NarL/FixJ family response regulator
MTMSDQSRPDRSYRPKVHILIADDHDIVRKGLRLVLQQEPDFEVVGEARDGAEALARAQALSPDVVLLDLKMPNMDGEAAARELRRQCSGARVLILSGAELDEGVLDVLEVDVAGYVPKDISPDELAHAIRIVAEGKSYIHADVTRLLLQRMAAVPAPTLVHAQHIKLSPREMEVLRLLPTPVTYREIGEKLFISEETVRSHVKNILVKLGQPNRTQAVVTAVKLGFITLE